MTITNEPGDPHVGCDGLFFGFIVCDTKGRAWIGNPTAGGGATGIARHVSDAGKDYLAAAHIEVQKDVGLTAWRLEPLTGPVWRPNCCDDSNVSGHIWRIYRVKVDGEPAINQRSFSNARWATTTELGDLAWRTLQYVRGEIAVKDWVIKPGIKPIWVRWFDLTGLINVPGVGLEEIDLFLRAT